MMLSRTENMKWLNLILLRPTLLLQAVLNQANEERQQQKLSRIFKAVTMMVLSLLQMT